MDRGGTVKILDMGLARFFRDEGDDLTKKFDENCVLGTADYCAPEQALNSHAVDIRVDIYSLGATFYYCLTGRTPFGDGTTAQKIIWHQMKEPTPIRELRPEVPQGLADGRGEDDGQAVEERYQTPAEVFEALAPWDAGDIAAAPRGRDAAAVPALARGRAPPTPARSAAPPPRRWCSRAPPGPARASGVQEPTAISRAPGSRSAKAAKSPEARDAEPEDEPCSIPAGRSGCCRPASAGPPCCSLLLGGVGLLWALSDRSKPVAVAPPARPRGTPRHAGRGPTIPFGRRSNRPRAGRSGYHSGRERGGTFTRRNTTPPSPTMAT